MPVLKFQRDNAISWFSAPGDATTQTQPLLHSWLTDTGLLTARLRQQCSDGFRLEVIEDSFAWQPDSNAEKLRRIVLWCGDHACIYAETLLPETTIAEHPWLKELGDEPLGEALQRRLDVSRGKFEFALLTPNQLPIDLPAPKDIALWTRRSEFFIGSTSLTVTEIFLPGIIECLTHRSRSVN